MNMPSFKELFAKEIQENKEAWEYFFENFKDKVPGSFDAAPNGWRYMDCGTWDEFRECSAPVYYGIAKKCKEHGITHVYDIGCCTAWQGRIFKAMGIEYTGIEAQAYDGKLAPKEDGITFMNKAYPFPIEAKDKAHTAAISNLCVGFNLREGNSEGKEDFPQKMYEQIAKDFDYFIGSVGPDAFKYFGSCFGVLDADMEYGAVYGNRERFRAHEFSEEGQKKVMGDMSIFSDFDITKMVAREKENAATSDKENKEIINNTKSKSNFPRVVFIRPEVFKRMREGGKVNGKTTGIYLTGLKAPDGEYYNVEIPFKGNDKVSVSIIRNSDRFKGWAQVRIQPGGVLDMQGKDGKATLDEKAFVAFVENKNRKAKQQSEKKYWHKASWTRVDKEM